MKHGIISKLVLRTAKWLSIAAAVICLAALAACSDNDSPSTTQPGSMIDDLSSSDDISGDIPGEMQGNAAVANPADNDNDDRPGLIVTGLDGSDPAGVTSPWLVNLRIFRFASVISGSGDADVDLLQYNDDFPVSRHIDFYERSLDSCEVDDPDAIEIEGGPNNEGSGPPAISGGQSVVINTPSGPWFTLGRTIENGESIYSTNNGLPGELLPEGATLSIPGDVFPTVDAHPLFETDPPISLLPDRGQAVSTVSGYTWIPSDRSVYMTIHLIAYDAEGDFVDFAVSCDVIDDGVFTMPDNVLEFVASTRFTLIPRYTRRYNRLDVANGIVIRQRLSIAE